MICAQLVSENMSPPVRERAFLKCMAASLDLSREQPRQREKMGVGGHVLRSFLEVTLVPHQVAAGPLLLTSACCLRGVVSLPRFRHRTAKRGPTSKDSGRIRPRRSPSARLARRRHHTRGACDRAIVTLLERQTVLPRSGRCSPSPMARAEASMACGPDICWAARELSRSPRPSLVAVCGERPCSMDGESPSLRLAGRLATVCSQIGPLP